MSVWSIVYTVLCCYAVGTNAFFVNSGTFIAPFEDNDCEQSAFDTTTTPQDN